MELDEYDYRPITFEGVEFPATLMAVDLISFSKLCSTEDELGEWLWRLPICCGVTKSAPAEKCSRLAQKALDLISKNRKYVLGLIDERLVEFGFDPEQTYTDWVTSLIQIIDLSKNTEEECVWSAPSHPNDPYQTKDDFHSLLMGLHNTHIKALEEKARKRKWWQFWKSPKGEQTSEDEPT